MSRTVTCGRDEEECRTIIHPCQERPALSFLAGAEFTDTTFLPYATARSWKLMKLLS